MMRTFVSLSVGLLLVSAGWAFGQGQARQAGAAQAGQAGQAGQNQFTGGKIVRMDRDRNTVTIKGTGANAQEREYRLSPNTKYFGRDNKALNDGFRNELWREGSDVYWRMGPGDTGISEFHYGTVPNTGVRPGGAGATTPDRR